MSPAPITRRALLGATAAAGAIGVPVSAEAEVSAAHADAELFQLFDLWREARAAWDATDEPLGKAHARAEAEYPPRPDALRFKARDILYGLGPTSAHEPLPNGRFRGLYTQGDVERLRTGPPVTMWGPFADDEEPYQVPDLKGEARRQEIIRTHDVWMAERKAVEDAVGYTGEVERAETLYDAWNATDDDLSSCRPRTVAGLIRKAAWVADCLAKDIGRDDLGEVFARQVAAFGGTAS